MILLKDIAGFLAEHDLRGGFSCRANNVVIYIKAGECIEDFLTMSGAPLSAMKLMQEKMIKAIRNHINRQNNFADANLDKAIDAAYEQRQAIKKLTESGKLSSLGEDMQLTARLREENPYASLAELAAMANISRSGIYHRLRKLCELSKIEK